MGAHPPFATVGRPIHGGPEGSSCLDPCSIGLPPLCMEVDPPRGEEGFRHGSDGLLIPLLIFTPPNFITQ